MLAVLSSHTLAVVEPVSLKPASLASPPRHSLDAPATAIAWAADNSGLFVATSGVLRKYDNTGQFQEDVYNYEGSISSMTVKERSSVIIFALETKVHVLECSSGSITNTLECQDSPVTSISLSDDATLLAITTRSSCTVHNLSHASHSSLRGWPASQSGIITSAFHPHTRTRLLLGLGDRLLIYDTSRPSGPIKTVLLTSISGSVVAIACSPFSKTLVAVGSSGGNVILVDLEKEKGVIKQLDMKVPLTSASFSQDGGTILLGTENGKLLVQDLRGLDKPAKSMTINDNGDKIMAVAVQKKIKNAVPSSAPSKAAVKSGETAAKPLTPQDVNKPASTRRTADATSKKAPVENPPTRSPVQRRAIASTRAVNSPAVRKVLSTATPTATPGKVRRAAGAQAPANKAFSPTRTDSRDSEGPSDISVQLDILTGLSSKPKAKPMVASPASSTSSKRTPITSAQTKAVDGLSRTRTVPNALSGRMGTGETVSLRTRTAVTRTVSATGSKKSSPLLDVPSAKPAKTEKTDLVGRTGTRPRALSAMSSVSTHARAPDAKAERGRECSKTDSGTPSPDLPSPLMEPVTPLPTRRKAIATGVLGLGTPEVERWARAGDGPVDDHENNDIEDEQERQANAKRKGKFPDRAAGDARRVGFFEDLGAGSRDDAQRPTIPSTDMQISPRRPLPTSSSSNSRGSPFGLSPLRSVGAGIGSPSRPPGGAQDLLRAVIKDVMYEFRQEAREEVVGLHLDLVRLGRGWKSELRALMDEYVGDLRELREENRMLREENERFRRGY